MQESDTSEVVDLTRARVERLEAEELRLLAMGVGDHLPIELVLRVERLRVERRTLGREPAPAA